MTSFFDRQTNCLTEPERELTFGFLLIHLDPFAAGMVKTAYDAAWAPLGVFGEQREEVYRATFGLHNLTIAGIDFVVAGVPAWFSAWASSISAGDSDPFASCVCDSF